MVTSAMQICQLPREERTALNVLQHGPYFPGDSYYADILEAAAHLVGTGKGDYLYQHSTLTGSCWRLGEATVYFRPAGR